MKLTQELLKELLHYDPDSGVFTWRERGNSAFDKRYAGKEAGTINDRGYRKVSISGVVYRAHRLAFMYMKGRWPRKEVDHLDHDKLNNRWLNLRDTSHPENGRNKSKFKNNTSGINGVNWNSNALNWRAQIMVSGKNKQLGSFDNIEFAQAARLEAEREYGYHENHGMVAA